ncbi:MAG TPA: hypothetical protein VG206_20520 [Terriglobia bacterium]|nr:hypothetical protein [Terriglobia bacterium]
METTTRPRLVHFGWLAIGLAATVAAGALFITRQNIALGLAATLAAVASIAKSHRDGKAAGNFDVAIFYYSCGAAALSLLVVVFALIRHANWGFVGLATANFTTTSLLACRAHRMYRSSSKGE